MPVTLPAHAALILPLQRLAPGVLPGTALLAGCVAPDLAYVLAPLTWGRFSHDAPTFAFFCLPAGLLLYCWLELLVLPVLRLRLPELGGVQWARFAVSAGPPERLRGWIGVAAAVLLGALTHVLWDGFTHGWMWPARSLYPGVKVTMGGQLWPLTRVVQHSSSVIGSAVVLLVLARRYPALPPAPGGPARGFVPLLLWTTIFALAGLLLAFWRRPLRMAGLSGLESELWWSFWPSVTGALIGLTLACALSARPAAARHLRDPGT